MMKTARDMMLVIACVTGFSGNADAETMPEGISGSDTPSRVVMLYIDGLHPEALDRYELPAIQSMIQNGTSAQRAVMPFPTHPTLRPFGDWHTTSFPNVATLAGTIFLEARPRYLQHSFAGRGATLHAAGSNSYRSLNDGFNYTFTNGNVDDAALIDFYIEQFEDAGDIVFARIMLQQTGNAGRIESGRNATGDPWSQNIFADGSPYGSALEMADAEIGRLFRFLEIRGVMDDTLVILMGDGQSRHGWHLTLDPDSETTPLIMRGPGIRKGHAIPYAETIDVVPTVAHLMNVDLPNANAETGVILTSLLEDGRPLNHPRKLERLNHQIREHERLKAEITLRAFDDPGMNLLLMELNHELLSPVQFYGQDRIMEWARSGSIDDMLDKNAQALQIMRDALDGKPFYFDR